MKNLKKDLQAVSREIKALTKKVENLITTVNKIEKPAAIKKKVTKKPAAKKPAKLSAVATILDLIQGLPEGIDTATLVKKTGFANAKIHTIVYNLKKQGKVKSEKKGFYVKA